MRQHVSFALGGSSYAAIKVTGKNVKNGTLTGVDVKNGSLLAQDFGAGQLPAGAQGPKGDQGAQGLQGLPGAKGEPGEQGDPGEKGDTATVDTSQFYDRAESDARYLGLAAKAADAEQLQHLFRNDSGEALSVYSDTGGGDPTTGVLDDGQARATPVQGPISCTGSSSAGSTRTRRCSRRRSAPPTWAARSRSP